MVHKQLLSRQAKDILLYHIRQGNISMDKYHWWIAETGTNILELK